MWEADDSGDKLVLGKRYIVKKGLFTTIKL